MMPNRDPHRSDLEALFPELVLTVGQIAERLHRCETTILRAIGNGRLMALPGTGRPYLVTRSGVIAWALGETTPREPSPEADAPPPAVADNTEPSPPAPRAVTQAALERRQSMPPKRRAA